MTTTTTTTPSVFTGHAWFSYPFLLWHAWSLCLTCITIIAPLSIIGGIFPPSLYGRAVYGLQTKACQTWCRSSLAMLSWWGVSIEFNPGGLETLLASSRQQRSVIVCSNHRSDFDAMFLSAAFPQYLRFVMKESLKHVPGIGWMAQMMGHVFLSRNNWERDRLALRSSTKVSSSSSCTVVFPEGTIFQPDVRDHRNSTYGNSQAERFTHVMIPKWRGIYELTRSCGGGGGSPVILQTTIIFPEFRDTPWEHRMVEWSVILSRGMPRRIYIHIEPPNNNDGDDVTTFRRRLDDAFIRKSDRISAKTPLRRRHPPSFVAVHASVMPWLVLTFWCGAWTFLFFLAAR